MNVFTITPDGSLRHASRLEAEALADWSMQPSEPTGDLFGQFDASTERAPGFDSNADHAYAAWLP